MNPGGTGAVVATDCPTAETQTAQPVKTTTAMAGLSLEMTMRFDMFCGRTKLESHPSLTPSARRKCFAGYRCNLVLLRVFLPIKFVMDYIINTRGRHGITWFEYSIVCRIGILSVFDLSAQAITFSKSCAAIISAC